MMKLPPVLPLRRPLGLRGDFLERMAHKGGRVARRDAWKQEVRRQKAAASE
jgi:hypothetical protein